MKGYLDAKELESYKKEGFAGTGKAAGRRCRGNKERNCCTLRSRRGRHTRRQRAYGRGQKAAAEAAAKAEEEKAAAEAAAKAEEEKAAAEATAKAEEEKAAAEAAAKAEEEKESSKAGKSESKAPFP